MDWGTVKGESEQLFLCNKNILHCLGQPGNPQQQIQKRNNPTALLGMHARMHTHMHTKICKNAHAYDGQNVRFTQLNVCNASVFRKDIKTIGFYLSVECVHLSTTKLNEDEYRSSGNRGKPCDSSRIVWQNEVSSHTYTACGCCPSFHWLWQGANTCSTKAKLHVEYRKNCFSSELFNVHWQWASFIITKIHQSFNNSSSPFWRAAIYDYFHYGF